MGRYKGFNKYVGLLDLSFLIAMFVWKKPNQNFKVLITGMTGRGKSDLMLFLSFNVACWLSILKYGRPGEWREFFNYDGTYGLTAEEIAEKKKTDDFSPNLIVINKDKMMKLSNCKKVRFSIIDLDEVEVIANAIDYKDPETRFFNRLNQLLRNRGWLIFATIQEQGVHAKQSRNLYHIVIDMDAPDATEYSVNFSRAFYVSLKSITSQSSGAKAQRIQYPREQRKKWILGASMLAPPEIRKFYLKVRDEEEQASTELGMEEIIKTRKYKEARYNRVVGESDKEKAVKILRVNPERSNVDVAKELGIKDTSRISRWRQQEGIPRLKKSKTDENVVAG